MAQSDERVPGRTGEPRVRPSGGRPPASFGRPEPDEVVVPPEPEPLRVVDGQVRIAVGAELVISDEAAQELYDQVRSIIGQAVADGLADGVRAGEPALEEPAESTDAPAGDAAGPT